MPAVLDYKSAIKHGNLKPLLASVNYNDFDIQSAILNLFSIIEILQSKPKTLAGIGKLNDHVQKILDLYPEDEVIKSLVLRLYLFVKTESLMQMHGTQKAYFSPLKSHVEKICDQSYRELIACAIEDSLRRELDSYTDKKPIDKSKVDRIIFINKDQLSDPEMATVVRNIIINKSYRASTSKTPAENIRICFHATELLDMANSLRVENLDVLGHYPRFYQIYATPLTPETKEYQMKIGNFCGHKKEVGKKIGNMINKATSLTKIRLFSCFSAGDQTICAGSGTLNLDFANVVDDSLIANILSVLSQQRKHNLVIKATPYAISAIPDRVSKPFFVATKSGVFLWQNGRYQDTKPENLIDAKWIRYSSAAG